MNSNGNSRQVREDPDRAMRIKQKRLHLLWAAALTIYWSLVFVGMFPSLVAAHKYPQFPHFMPAGSVYRFPMVVCAIDILSQTLAVLGAAGPSRISLALYMVPSIGLIFAWILITIETYFGIIFVCIGIVRCCLAFSLLLDLINNH